MAGGAGAVTLYGIKNCDTVRKARRWLEDHGIEYRFHDFRSDGLDRGTIAAWSRIVGWEALVNRSSATWRGLPEQARSELNEATAGDLLVEHPTLIKRPVLVVADAVRVGFDPETYARVFGAPKRRQ